MDALERNSLQRGAPAWFHLWVEMVLPWAEMVLKEKIFAKKAWPQILGGCRDEWAERLAFLPTLLDALWNVAHLDETHSDSFAAAYRERPAAAHRTRERASPQETSSRKKISLREKMALPQRISSLQTSLPPGVLAEALDALNAQTFLAAPTFLVDLNILVDLTSLDASAAPTYGSGHAPGAP